MAPGWSRRATHAIGARITHGARAASPKMGHAEKDRVEAAADPLFELLQVGTSPSRPWSRAESVLKSSTGTPAAVARSAAGPSVLRAESYADGGAAGPSS